jgi:hypothetical protein
MKNKNVQIIYTILLLTDNSNQIFNNYDPIKWCFELLILLRWPVLYQSDEMNRIITSTIITLSGFHCTMNLR